MPDQDPPWPPPGWHGHQPERSPPHLTGAALSRYEFLRGERRRVAGLAKGYENYLQEIDKQLADLLKNGYPT
jgi:hypothetical protein